MYADHRISTAERALKLADPDHVLEIGGGREECSSTLFWCKNTRMVISINDDPEVTKSIKEACRKNKRRNLRAITAKVADWLPTHYGNFDILFMDAWDEEDENYQEKYVEMYHLLKDRLGNSSVIVIDNTPRLNPEGNGIQVIEAAKQDGWVIAKQDHQVLLAKRAN